MKTNVMKTTCYCGLPTECGAHEHLGSAWAFYGLIENVKSVASAIRQLGTRHSSPAWKES
jgi:hypothetical protein